MGGGGVCPERQGVPIAALRGAGEATGQV
jgi:hypothetical protein